MLSGPVINPKHVNQQDAPITLYNRFFTSFAVAVALGVSAGTASATLYGNGDFQTVYNAATGNMTLVFTGTGASGAGPVSLQSLSLASLGNATVGPAMPAGFPNVTAGQGAMNGARATLPTASFQVFNSGTQAESGLNGIYSQVGNSNIGSTWITFQTGGTTQMDMGAIAPLGWSQADVDGVGKPGGVGMFITDPDVSPNTQLNYGAFLYAELTGGFKLGPVVVVPEPATTVLAGIAGVIGCCIAQRRLRRRA